MKGDFRKGEKGGKGEKGEVMLLKWGDDGRDSANFPQKKGKKSNKGKGSH